MAKILKFPKGFLWGSSTSALKCNFYSYESKCYN